MGDDERMSHCLSFSCICSKWTKELLNGSVTSLYCTWLKWLSAQIDYACSHSLTCEAFGLSNRR
jgi:hypothetical protein